MCNCVRVILSVWTIALLLSVPAKNTVPIRVIILTVGNNPVYGRVTTKFAYELGFSHAKLLYPRVFQNFTVKHFHTPGNFSCAEAVDEMTILVSRLYDNDFMHANRNTSTVVLAPGCTSEIMVVGDFAREIGVPVLASTAVGSSLANKVRFPTVVTTGCSTYDMSTIAVTAVIRHFSLTSATIICDKRSLDALSAGITLACTTTMERLNAKKKFNLLVLHIDSSFASEGEFERQLLLAKKHGPALILDCIPEVQKILLSKAFDLDLHKINFIFFIFRVTEFPLYRNVWADSDEMTRKASILLPRCIEIGGNFGEFKSHFAFWVDISQASRVVNEYMQRASSTFKINALQLAAYETVMMMAKVFDETYGDLKILGFGTEFARRFHNRSFKIANYTIDISGSGMRINSVSISLYNTMADQFEEVWYLNRSTTLLEESSTDKSFRDLLRAFAKEPCQYNAENCTSEYKLLPVVSLVFLIAATTGTTLVCRHQKKVVQLRENSWWIIDDAAITYDGVGPTINSDIYLCGYLVNHLMSHNSGKPIMEEVVYMELIVEIVRFELLADLDIIFKRKKTLAVLKLLRCLDHPNLAKFYGVAFHRGQGNQVVVLVESSRKGLLRNMIDNDSFILNWDLRFSLIWDIIEGLRFLHSTAMKCHGFLCFVNFIIDKHFTLKIAHTGLTSLYSSFFDQEIPFPIPLFLSLWFAPEVINDPLAGMTQSADIYSLGIVLYEMVTRNAPFDVDITNEKQIAEMVNHIKSGKLDAKEYPMPNAPPLICAMVAQCWSPTPAKRPDIANICSTLINVHPSNNLSFTENLINRLEDYSKELESAISLRTYALQEEESKVEALLSNLLPSSIVLKLRNKVKIVPEFFDSVTVLFSGIPAFNAIVTTCSPFAVVHLLQSLYSTLDDVITRYSVYKVETVKDSYMVASGLAERNDQHAVEVALLSLMMLQYAALIRTPAENNHKVLRLRIGISSGPCMAAVIGLKRPHYCLVGDTVNTASRMESYGEGMTESKIHVSASTKKLLDATDLFSVQLRGEINVKGKGEMSTFWLALKIN